jgi:hypothetical protein
VAFKYILAQTGSLRPEKYAVVGMERDLIVRRAPFAGGKNKRGRISIFNEVLKGLPYLQVHPGPVIEAGPFQTPLIQLKSQWFDQMQLGANSQTESAHISGIRRNLRIYQGYTDHGFMALTLFDELESGH